MTIVKKKSPLKKITPKNKNKTIILILLLPVILIISYNEFYHFQIHENAETITSGLKKIIPLKIKVFSKTKKSIFAPNVSEVILSDGKLIISSKTSFNPLMNHVEMDYRPLSTDQSPLKFYLYTRFLDLETIEFLLKTQTITLDMKNVEADFRDIEMKMNLPLKFILKPKNNIFNYITAGIDIKSGEINLTDIKTKKNIFKIDGMHIASQIEEINSASLKNKLIIGFKKLTVPGIDKTKPNTFTDSDMKMTVGNFNKVELVKMISHSDPKPDLPGLQTIMNMGSFFDSIDINLEHNGTFETKPFKIEATLKIPEMTNLMTILNSLELQINFHLPNKVIIKIAKQKISKLITEHFFKYYQTENPVAEERIQQIEVLISQKIPDDLIRKVISHFHQSYFLKLSSFGTLFCFTYSKGTPKIFGMLASLEMFNLKIEELIKVFYLGKMEGMMEELNIHLHQNGFVFTKKIIPSPESILIPEVTQPPSIAIKSSPAIAPDLNIRSIPINHKPASSLEKVQNDKYYQDFRDKKYQDCWVNENVSGYSQIFTVKKFRGNYTDLQADAFLAILPAYVKNGQCKLK